ncbi:MAG: class I SAM-dependent methyltransferase [Cyclobacteriaceae bacterium]|nr:class I SAM-dependent methyltransferase [Cyclobacteriaceae bacterium]
MALPSSIEHTREDTVQFFQQYVRANNPWLKGKSVIDLSAGTGYIAHLFEGIGSVVTLYDLFPQNNQYAKATCQVIDLTKSFPIKDSVAELVILSETIDHLPDTHFTFQEIARILKIGGTLLLTTPNPSSLRSRLSYLLTESEHYSIPAINEYNAYVQWPGNDNRYFNRAFTSGVLRLRTLAALQGLRLVETHPSSQTSTSRWLLWLYPLIYFFSWRNLRKQIKADPAHAADYKDIFKLNTSLRTLLSRHFIAEFRKV